MTSLLCSGRYTFAALSSALCYFNYSFMEPILAERLVVFDLSSMQIGLFFAIFPIFYIPASVIVQFMPRRIEKRVTIIFAAFLSGVGYIFVGPSDLFNFPDSLVLMGVGQALAGIFSAFLIVPGLPEMVEATLPLYPGQEREVNDLSSGIFNAFLGFGQVVAPAYGSFMTEAVGFRMTSDVVALLCMFFAILYFACAGGVEAFRKSCRPTRPTVRTDRSDDFFNMKHETDDVLSLRSRKNSSFCMIGPTSPTVSRMRLNSLMEDEFKLEQMELYDQSGLKIDEDDSGTPVGARRRAQHGRLRIHSDADFSPWKDPASNNIESLKTSIL